MQHIDSKPIISLLATPGYRKKLEELRTHTGAHDLHDLAINAICLYRFLFLGKFKDVHFEVVKQDGTVDRFSREELLKQIKEMQPWVPLAKL